MISQRNYVNQPTQNKSRKTRDGDWICIKCSNYNYAFRDICNRCHLQNKKHNQQQMQAIGKQNYGQNSFPSVVFVNMNNQQTQRNTNNQNYNNSNIQQLNNQHTYHNNQQLYQNNYVNNQQYHENQTYCNYNYQYNNYYQNNQYQFYTQQQQCYEYNNMYTNINNKQKQIYSHRRVISIPSEENLVCFNSYEQEQEQISKDQKVIDQFNSLIPQNIWISSLIDD